MNEYFFSVSWIRKTSFIKFQASSFFTPLAKNLTPPVKNSARRFSSKCLFRNLVRVCLFELSKHHKIFVRNWSKSCKFSETLITDRKHDKVLEQAEMEMGWVGGWCLSSGISPDEGYKLLQIWIIWQPLPSV